MKRLLLAAAQIAALSGCMGDGGFDVTGSVRSSSDSALHDCKLRLIVGNAELNSYYTSEFVAPKFSDSFLVATYKEDYPLLVECDGHKPHKTIIRYGRDVLPDRPANLGVIVLQSNGVGT
jgi:hypothetical protein